MENTKEVTVQIKVEDYNSEFYCTDYGFIPKSACTVVLSPSVEETEGEVKGFVLPEKWFCTKNQYADSWMGYMLPSPANYFNSSKHWSKNISTMQTHYKEITNDQFFDHVFNKEFPSDITVPEPKGYCIKRTPENAEVLNEWANKFQLYKLSWTNGWIYSKPVGGSMQGDIIEGFRELSTVSEFFEKVGYTPEPERTPIGTYDGQPIYEDTEHWFISIDELRIIEGNFASIKSAAAGNSNDNLYYSKVYLTPEAVNERLRSECEKKAIQRGLTGTELVALNELFTWNTSHKEINVLDYTIELVEKEFNIKYLTPNTENK